MGDIITKCCTVHRREQNIGSEKEPVRRDTVYTYWSFEDFSLSLPLEASLQLVEPLLGAQDKKRSQSHSQVTAPVDAFQTFAI